jgi:amino acid transporter
MQSRHNRSTAGPALERAMGLHGAVALVVGAVIGAGIYSLIGPIAAMAGGATWLAFISAMTISLIGVIPVIQIACTLPRAGGGYLFTSRLLFPMAGTILSAWVLIAGTCSTAVATLALVTYLPLPAHPLITPHSVGLALVLAFYLILLLGLRMAVGVQIVMVAQMLLALFIYCVAGIFRADLQMSLTPREGATGFLMAVVLCYNSCFGFQVLAEMGEEIKNARRTIPLALLFGGLTVTLIYVIVGTVLVGTLPFSPDAYKDVAKPLGASAALFLPAPVVAFIGFGAVTAGLTSLNAAAMSLPREVFAQARDGMLPERLARVGGRTHTPIAAVTVFFALMIAVILTFRDLEFYGYTAAVGLQVMTSVLCIASLRLRAKYPDRYEKAFIRFPNWALLACTAVTVLASIGFVALIVSERPSVAAIYGVLTVLAAAYHAARVRYLRNNGFPWDERVGRIPGSDEAASGVECANQQQPAEYDQEPQHETPKPAVVDPGVQTKSGEHTQ